MNREILFTVAFALVLFGGAFYAGTLVPAGHSAQPFPCQRCLAMGDRTWFIGEVDSTRPYDGILLMANVKQPDGSFKRSVKRCYSASFADPPKKENAAAAKAIEQGKKDLAGAEATVKK